MLIATMACAAAPLLAETPFTVDFSQEVGAIKKLNGICNAAPLNGTQKGGLEKEIAALKIPFYRFHDAALENPGYALVDVTRIFPLFHLDADDARNYNFEVTDDYIRGCVESGAKIDFRLGESIEHARKNYRVNPPKDFEKWAEICAHIVRHYNAGWAKGFHWNIEYWSVWEEPDNPELLTGDSYEKVYFPLYAATVKRLKREFPGIKVGGPNCMGPWNSFDKFIDYCAANALPLDFACWTRYARRPEEYFDEVVRVRKFLNERGYAKTEININEWHLAPVSWSGFGSIGSARHGAEWLRELTATPSVVFVDATLIKMQDAPVDAMFYYSMKTSSWGIFDSRKQPRGHYYALKAFAPLAEDGTRVAAPTCPDRGWYQLASKGKDGRGHVLLAALHAEGDPRLVLKGGVKPVSVQVIDTVRNLEPVADWNWNGKVLRIPRLYSDSCVWLVEVEPAE